jgi:hypothetical protein
MKCHAGVEFESGKPCPRCHAKLGEVCWPGVNADLLELARLRKGIQNYLDGNYLNPRQNRPEPCKHDHLWYQGCDECDDEYFTSLLRGPSIPNGERGGQ